MKGEDVLTGINPYRVLSKLKMDLPIPQHYGGLVGFSSHEMANYILPHVNLMEHEDFPPFLYGLFLDGLILDTQTGEVKYYTVLGNRLAEIMRIVNGPEIQNEVLDIRFKGHSVSRDKFTKIVIDTQEKIKSGLSFQSEVGFKSNYVIVGDKLSVYDKLREVNPSPYMYYLKFKDIELIGASPEILISSHRGINGSNVMRYHSLMADAEYGVPQDIIVTSVVKDSDFYEENGVEIMAIKVRGKRIYGLQFHPESFASVEGRKYARNFIDMLD